MAYLHRTKNIGRSSAELGPCEVCRKHCSEVHYLVQYQVMEDGNITYHGGRNLWGHLDCITATVDSQAQAL